MEREVDRLKRKLLALSARVEENLYAAVKSVEERNSETAEQVIFADREIDLMEVEVEEDCLKVLALHQPVAIDLRFIIAVLKINNDVERIGDLAVNIAWRAKSLAQRKKATSFFQFQDMASKVRAMVRKSLESLVAMDAELAREVCRADNEIDEINHRMHSQIRESIRNHPDDLEALLYMISVSRNLERIADHATNIAEDVIYMIQGEIVRHRTAEFAER